MLTHALSTLGLRAAFVAPLLAFALSPVLSAPAPCTTFCLVGKDGPIFGRNYDWGVGVANVTVNRRGLVKSSLVEAPVEPVHWTSKYGSITFNQYGHEFPTGGMNEAGLVVEVMWLTSTRYPDPDSRPGMRELTWVQWQLDNSRNVQEVLASDAKLRVLPESVSIHFLVCDRSGEMATVEFLDGKLVAHSGDDLPIPALTNDPYSDSMKYLKTITGFGGDRPTPKSGSSLDRFARAACGVVEYEPSSVQEAVEYAFKVLADVSQGTYTKWSIVYDIDQRLIHFRTAAAPTIKSIKLAAFDFSPGAPCRILDIDTPKAGDPTPLFRDYTKLANRKLVLESWKNTDFLADTPDERLNVIINYPDSVHAVEPETNSIK